MRGSFSARNPFKFLFGTTRREQYVERYVLREHSLQPACLEVLAHNKRREQGDPEPAEHRLPQRLIIVQREIPSHWHIYFGVLGPKAPHRIRIGMRVDETVVINEILRRFRYPVFVEIA